MKNLTKEQRNFVKKILEIPSADITNKALEYVNLSTFQREIIQLTSINKLSEMQVIDYYNNRDNKIYERSTIERAKKDAFERMYAVWSNNYFISIIINSWAR